MLDQITADDLLKTEDILTASPDSSLSHALNLLTSSHDAVFVADGDKLLGIISPYQALFKSNLPPDSKLKNCLFSPPKLKRTTGLPEIARRMVESKVYFLPVYEQNGKWLGIVTKRRILKLLGSQEKLAELIPNLTERKRLVTVKSDLSLGKARAMMKQSGHSRLVVVDNLGNLRGILTRFDLRGAFVAPKSSQSSLSRKGQKTKASQQSIKTFVKNSVATAKVDSNVVAIVQQMVERDIGSIVLVNKNFQPAGIVSTQDILSAISSSDPNQSSKLIINVDSGVKDDFAIRKIVKKAFFKLRRKHQLIRLTVKLSLSKNSAGETKSYTCKLLAENKSTNFSASATHHHWRKALMTSLKKLESQLNQ